nr:hypothetical protein CFP56_39026 [Quercus suber]
MHDLHAILQGTPDYKTICHSAHHFRSLPSYALLQRRTINQQDRNVWSFIHHYVGRLSSWLRVTRRLMWAAKTYPHFIQCYRVDSIDLHNKFGRDLSRAKDEYENALSHVCEQVHESWLRPAKIVQISSYSSFHHVRESRPHRCTPFVHAELIMLEWFYLHDRHFVKDDRYIGCSKPSCYCCELYMLYHPLKLVERPCHGNIWVQWRPPFSISPHQVLKPSHSSKTVQRMIDRLDHEVRVQQWHGFRPGGRMLDSTTGLSDSLHRLESLDMA